MIAQQLVTRQKQPISGIVIYEDAVYWWTQDGDAVCKWNKAWFYR